MKKAVSIAMALAMAVSTLVACGKPSVNVTAPTITTNSATTTPVEFEHELNVENLADSDQVEQFADVPDTYTNVKLQETVQIQKMVVRIYSYTNDGLSGIFLTDQLGHTYNLYDESEYYVNEDFNIGFGATKRFDDSAYLWVYPKEYGFMTVCHPNK